MPTTDEKILQALETFQADVTSMKGDVTTLKNGQVRLEQGQAQIRTELGAQTTALEALKAGQDDIREQLATKADKADIQELAAKIDKYQRKNEQRFENLEDATGAHNPHKN